MVSGRSGRALINTNADKSFKQLILSRGKNRNRIEAKPSSFEKVGYTDGAAHHIIVIALELLLLHPPDASFFATSPISLHLIPLWGRLPQTVLFHVVGVIWLCWNISWLPCWSIPITIYCSEIQRKQRPNKNGGTMVWWKRPGGSRLVKKQVKKLSRALQHEIASLTLLTIEKKKWARPAANS